jgi:hypothetical protein
MLAPPLATSWQTTHRFRMSGLDAALGRRNPSVALRESTASYSSSGSSASERTVSRYLPDRRRAPSQTWRTFLANHFGQFTFISPEPSLYAPGDDDVVDGSGLTFAKPRCRAMRRTPLTLPQSSSVPRFQ